MSYILEALKKSEQDRALGNVPTLFTAHDKDGAAGPRRSLWAVLGIVVISGVAAAAWYQYRSGAETSAAIPLEAESATTTVTSTPVSDPAAAEVKPALPAVGQDAENPVRATASPAQTPSYTDVTASTPLLELNELPPETLATLPSLAINVVSFSRTESRRFVMIDQVIYKEGQKISRDLSVDEITPDGAVLTYRGNRFLARP